MIYKTLLFDLDSTLIPFGERYANWQLLEQQGVVGMSKRISIYVPMNRANGVRWKRLKSTRERTRRNALCQVIRPLRFWKSGRNPQQSTKPFSDTKPNMQRSRGVASSTAGCRIRLIRCHKRHRRFKGTLVELANCEILQKKCLSRKKSAHKAEWSLLWTVAGAIPGYDKDKAVIIGD